MKRRIAGFMACLAVSAMGQQSYTYEQLVDRVINLEQLATLPPAGEKAGLCSSHDRASVYDSTSGSYQNWGANDDGAGFIRREGSAYVLAEMSGPGCITRIWSATADLGHVRIYLDGAAAPAVDLPFRSYFVNTVAPFDFPHVVYTTAANGLNNYVPIPYQSTCKIVADSGWGHYFQFTYTTFPAGTTVPTFALPLSAAARAALGRVDRFFADSLGNDPSGPRAGEQHTTRTLNLAAGQSSDALSVTGSGAITGIKVSVAGLASRAQQIDALRGLALSACWDGQTAPSVWAPLGDFFGTAIGINPYATLPLGMSPDTFYSYWYMPYSAGAVVRLTNDDSVARSVSLTFTTAPLSRPAGQLGRFHAKFHLDTLRSTAPGRSGDWTILRTTGRGRYVGVALHVYNYFAGWWGEGDEKFFVDNEKFPSDFGTGSEDYFGYAWSSDRLFNQALHAQTQNEFPGNKGHISVCRYQTADNEPFASNFEGAIEKFSDNASCPYAAVAYWYLESGGTDPYPPVPVAVRTGYYSPLPAVAGAIEGEDMPILRTTGGAATDQAMTGFGEQWSAGAQVFWHESHVGDSLVLRLDVALQGRYDLLAQLTTAGDYGIVQVCVDHVAVGTPVDCYHNGVNVTGQISLGTVTLTAGQHELTLVITGKNASSSNYLAGLDYVLLRPVGTPVVARAGTQGTSQVVRFGDRTIRVPFSRLLGAELLTLSGRRAVVLSECGASGRLAPDSKGVGRATRGSYILVLQGESGQLSVPVVIGD